MKRTKSLPWSYQKGSTLLHRSPAGFKLVFLIVLQMAAFFPRVEVLCAAVLVLAALSFAGGINPARLLRGSRPLLFIILTVFIIGGLELSPPRIRTEAVGGAALFCARIGTAFAAGSLLFAVTTSGEIRKSLSRLESFLHPGKPAVSLAVSLMLGFLPRFFEVWDDLVLAWKSRGGKRKLSFLTLLLPLALERMMEKAGETASALESRGM